MNSHTHAHTLKHSYTHITSQRGPVPVYKTEIASSLLAANKYEAAENLHSRFFRVEPEKCRILSCLNCRICC